MSKVLPNGIGETQGDPLVVNSPLFISGSVWYVDSENPEAQNSAGYGRTKQKPRLTLADTILEASAGDTIVLLDGHTEELALSGNTINVSKRLIIVGSGDADGEPTVTFTAVSGTGTALIALTAAGSEIRNVKFLAFETNDGAHQLDVQATHCRVIGCVFENSSFNQGCAINVETGLATLIRDVIVRSVATAANSLPDQGIEVDAGLVWLEDVEFDYGEFGWNGSAFATTAAAQVVAEGITMLNARAELIESGGQTHWCAPIQTGGAQIQET